VADYRFLTTWMLDASPTDVWDAIYHPEHWPEWWKGVVSVEKLAGGDYDGVGSVYRHRWRSVLPYSVGFDIRTTRVELPTLIEGEATGGLAGTGRWRFFQGDATVVTYEWMVRTTKPWMNALAPVARPFFEWNHDVVMRRGGEGLAGLLGARLLGRN
jgi:Polyketide cyclase / dehydrase and lipid transport